MIHDDAPYRLPARLDYVTARELAASPEQRVRLALAASQAVSPEILYYLAEDDDPEVRATVAANPDCPAKGNLLLAEDRDPSVRVALAGKIGRQPRPGAGTISEEILDHLVKDDIIEVRRIVAEALRDVADADAGVIRRLAHDAEILVAGPVLEFSPVLTDQDLLDIIAHDPVPGAISAIARRNYVDKSVTTAIVASNDKTAITHMLKNGNAQIQESVLDSLIERSAHEPTWQEPLVYRPELTQRSATRLAELVAVHLLDRILERKDLPQEAVRAVAKVVGERLKNRAQQKPAATSSEFLEKRYADQLEKARAAHQKNQLDELTLMVMMLVDPVEDLMVALAARSSLSIKIILDIIETQSPRPICALAWAAGLSPVFALELQTRAAGIALDKALPPAADGGYALSEKELRWQLEVYAGADGIPLPANPGA